MAELSSLERTFDTYWRIVNKGHYPEPVRQFQFTPPRKWKFDLAWPAYRIAVELEGGVYSGGRHTRGSGFEKDCEKYNVATLQGWRLLRFTTRMLMDNPTKAIQQIQTILDQEIMT